MHLAEDSQALTYGRLESRIGLREIVHFVSVGMERRRPEQRIAIDRSIFDLVL